MMSAPAAHVGDITISSVTERYQQDSVNFTGYYPQFSGIANRDAQQKLNVLMREKAQSALIRAKAAGMGLISVEGQQQRSAEGLYGYEVKRNNGGVVSLLFTDSLYAGGANGSEKKSGLTFASSTGDVYTLEGLFQDGAACYGVIDTEIRRQLKERGLVEYTQYSPIVLTREGRYYADRVISCHTMVKEFLITVLKMEEKRADEVACGIEHIMTLEEISRFQLLTEHCRKSGE